MLSGYINLIQSLAVHSFKRKSIEMTTMISVFLVGNVPKLFLCIHKIAHDSLDVRVVDMKMSDITLT